MKTASTLSAGHVRRCANCRAIVGAWRHPDDEIMFASAGYVTQIREPGVAPMFVCRTNGGGEGRSHCSVLHEHPLVCSDDCERAVLAKHGHFFAAQHVGVEDATPDDLHRIREQAAFLDYYGNTEDARMRLLRLLLAGWPIAPTAPAGLPVCP